MEEAQPVAAKVESRESPPAVGAAQPAAALSVVGAAQLVAAALSAVEAAHSVAAKVESSPTVAVEAAQR